MKTTVETVVALGLKAEPALPVEKVPEHAPKPPGSPKLVPSGADSMETQHAEFRDISKLWCRGIYVEGRSRAVVEAEICSMAWEHHKTDALAKTLAARTVYKTSDAGRLADEEWASVVADLTEHASWIGPCTLARRCRQRAKTLRANRAWCFEFLYGFHYSPRWNWTFEDCLEAFWNWDCFQAIREMSLAALKSVDAINEDLRHCWDRWCCNPTLVSQHHVDAVEGAIIRMGVGVSRHDLEQATGKGHRIVQRALNELVKAGKLVIHRAGRSTSYSVPGGQPKPVTPRGKVNTLPFPCNLNSMARIDGAILNGKAGLTGLRPGSPDFATLTPLERLITKNTLGKKRNNPALFEKLIGEALEAICFKTDWQTGSMEFVGTSTGRLYAFLARKCPIYRPNSGVELTRLDELKADNYVSASEYARQPDHYPRPLDDDLKKLHSHGGMVIKDLSTAALSNARREIQAVLTDQEFDRLVNSLHNQPWLRASRASMLMLYDIAIKRLERWMSDQLGERVENPWLGDKPKRDGVPVVAYVGRKKAETRVHNTAWDENKSDRDRQHLPGMARFRLPKQPENAAKAG